MEVPHEFYEKRSRELVRILQGRIEPESNSRYYSLVCGDTNIVVQADVWDVPDHHEGLEIIQNQCVRQINFHNDAPRWCFLVKSRGGRWKIVQKRRPLKRVTCPYWATLVSEREIEYLECPGLEFRYGRWRGQKVDIRLAWTDYDIPLLEREMTAYRRLQGANLTYEVLAHVTDDQGNVIGTMTEVMEGRPVRLEDRPLVESAMERLNSMGLMYEKPDLSSILITKNGDVRLTQVYNVFEIPVGDCVSAHPKLNLCWSLLRIHVFRALGTGMGICFAPHQFNWRIRVLIPLSGPREILRGSQEWVLFGKGPGHIAGSSPVFELEKARGQKRRALESGEDGREEETHPRPVRRKYEVTLAPESSSAYMPPPPPPNDFDDLPYIPTPIHRFEAGASLSTAVVLSLEGGGVESPYTWIYETPRTPPLSESRFSEVVDD